MTRPSTCSRELCSNETTDPYVSKRSDSVVRGLAFCTQRCAYLEAAVRKQRARRASRVDHETRWKRDLRKKYNMTQEDWDWLWEQQNGRCATCQIDLTTVGRICTDHDHKTGEVRGLLCLDCNHGLGKFKDDAETLMRAAQYVLADPPLRSREVMS